MEDAQRKIIRVNSPYLITNTTNLAPFLQQLYARGVISQHTKDLIESKPTPFDKLSLVYSEVVKTDKFTELISALDASENSLAAAKLRELPSSQGQRTNRNSTSDSESSNRLSTSASVDDHDDFTVSELGSVKIVSILENYPQMKTEWKKVIIHLKLSGKSQGELTDSDFGSLILKTLTLWRGEMGSDATFHTFVKVIQTAINHREVVEKLQNAKQDIRSI